jgi:dihydropyrimidine dehydrogenase (NAD+) subunit PreA
VARAFKAGWGGGVEDAWEHPPIVNVSSRYGGVSYNGARMAGSAHELTMTGLQVNRRDQADQAELAGSRGGGQPDGALHRGKLATHPGSAGDRVRRRELNFGCPHGMRAQHGFGGRSGAGYVEMVTRWCKQHTRMPVIVKLTPNHQYPACGGGAAGGADGVSLIIRCSRSPALISI